MAENTNPDTAPEPGRFEMLLTDRVRHSRKTTARMAEVHIKIIRAHFGSVPLSAIKPSDVRAWTAKLKAEGRADSSVYALHSRLSQLFTDAVHDGLVARNPCSMRTSPPMAKQLPDVAATAQVWALYEAFPRGVWPAVLVAALAGLRWRSVQHSALPTVGDG